MGPNQEVYIVYAYGNGEFTSKMDIVLFELKKMLYKCKRS